MKEAVKGALGGKGAAGKGKGAESIDKDKMTKIMDDTFNASIHEVWTRISHF